MRKLMLAFVLAGTVSFVNAQKTNEEVKPYAVPIDSISKLITYEGVIEVKNVSAEELYKRFRNWFNDYYKNPNEVIRENDSIKLTMTGKPRFRITNLQPNEAGKTEGGIVQYTITVTAKQGRFRYELSQYNWKQGASYFPCERWLDTKAQSYSPLYNNLLQELDKYSLETIQSLKNAVMVEKVVKDKDNW